MSISDLKHRLSDVPGIQSLSYEVAAGRMLLKWGEGYSAAADVTASDGEVEAAVRNAIRLPPVSLIPDAPASPAPANAAPATVQPMSVNPADTMNALDRVMTDHVSQMGQIHAAQLKILESTLARQRDSVSTGVGSMAATIDRQTDDFIALMSKYTNGGPK